MAFSYHSSTVWAATSDFKLEQYCCETGKLLKMIDTGHRDEITMLLVHPSDELLLSGGHDRVLRVWDCSKCEPLLFLHCNCVAIAFEARSIVHCKPKPFLVCEIKVGRTVVV
jgi:WD40 repeat protein